MPPIAARQDTYFHISNFDRKPTSLKIRATGDKTRIATARPLSLASGHPYKTVPASDT